MGDEAARNRADIIVPLIKAWGTDIGVEVAGLGIQNSTAGWASSRKPARPSTGAIRGLPRSMKAPTGFRRPTL